MISVYLHIPFCKQKCNYCSFYSLTDFDKEEYISAIIRCVEYWGKKTKQKADTVYIGGGTPSVLPPKLICRLLESVYDNFTVESGAEITVPLEEYRREVYKFADKIEGYYKQCSPKNMPDNEFERNGYIAFWNEWHRRRNA